VRSSPQVAPFWVSLTVATPSASMSLTFGFLCRAVSWPLFARTAMPLSTVVYS